MMDMLLQLASSQVETIEAGTILNGLLWIRPELLLTLGILIVIFWDLISSLKEKEICGYITLLVLVAGLALLYQDFQQVLKQGTQVPVGLGATLKVDAFALFMKFVFFVAAMLVTIFSLRQSEVPFLGQGEYYSLILSVTLAASLLSMSMSLLMIFLSFEFISLPQYVLAGSMKSERDSVEASLKYVIYGGVASGAMLFGFSLLYGFSGGQLDLPAINDSLATMEFVVADRVALTTIMILVLAGIGFKISAVPFHMWSPDVYQGTPTPIVALFSVGPKAAGLAFLFRFFYEGFYLPPAHAEGMGTVLGVSWPLIIAVISVASMTAGNLAALWQTNIKRLLAYSSIAHAGYILIGFVTVTQAGIEGMLFYIVIYLIMNMGIFVGAISLIDATGEEELSKYKGLGWELPLIAVPMVVFLVSLTGLPPTAGFTAKFILFSAAESAGMRWLLIIALLNTVVSLYYYVKIMKFLYLDRPDGERETELDRSKIRYSYTCLSVILLVATIGFFIYPGPIQELVAIATPPIF